MKTRLIIITVLAIGLSSCRSTLRKPTSASDKLSAAGDKVLLTVDFQKDRTLEYKFTSRKEITLDWDPEKTSGRDSTGKQSEFFEMVVAYTPVEVDSYGLTAIQATCKSVTVVRTKTAGGQPPGEDAVQNLKGKTFSFTVTPSGRIQDYSQLDKLIRETGEMAFRNDSSRGKIKEPDMIWDFIASQWFLWDSISSIEKPSKGVAIGQAWSSRLAMPLPMVLRKARDVTYRLAQIRSSASPASVPQGMGKPGRIAVIQESYKLAEAVPQGWPVPYSGRFQMSGTFGFLGPYEFLDLKGQGEELFNIDTGQLENYNQQYTVLIKASLPPLGIKANPQITINQRLTMELLKR